MKPRRSGLLLLLPLAVAALVMALASATSLTVAPVKANAFRVCALSGYPGTTTAVFDTYIDEEKKTKNFGTQTTVVVGSRSSTAKAAFLRFDLTKCSPAIATTAVIKQATLRLFITAQSASSRAYGAYRVDGASCPEGLSTCWGEDSLTYNNRPSALSTATASVTIATGSANNNKYYAWDVTADVVKIVAGTAANYGWRISDPTVNSGSGDANFTSAEPANAPQSPRLVVVYSP
ncbi:MAG: DNRLRE domain-containing protein [Acidimicrobiia bacterium]